MFSAGTGAPFGVLVEPHVLNGYCIQVVVFALGIGTNMVHAEQLIAAFKVLCQRCQKGHIPAPTGLPQATVSKPRFSSSAIDQQLSLREAFFASTIRSVHLSLVWTMVGATTPASIACARAKKSPTFCWLAAKACMQAAHASVLPYSTTCRLALLEHAEAVEH